MPTHSAVRFIPKALFQWLLLPEEENFLVEASLSDEGDNELKVEYAPWLIAGLGNPGSKFHGTRNNVGFEMIDRISRAEGVMMNVIQSKSLLGIVFWSIHKATGSSRFLDPVLGPSTKRTKDNSYSLYRRILGCPVYGEELKNYSLHRAELLQKKCLHIHSDWRISYATNQYTVI